MSTRPPARPPQRWFKGNLHTHTTRSDGDSPPEHVAGWYQAHEYDFLCLSDHDHLTILEDPHGSGGSWPLLVRGQEVTSRSVNVHVNGYGIGREVEALDGTDTLEVLREDIRRIRAAGGLASVNHPNYKWALSERDLLQADGYTFMEVFNGHSGANNHGGGGRAGVEALWDRLLSSGKHVWGIAVDDAHHFQQEFSADRANPGRGWVQVRAATLSEQALLGAMEKGDFYSSSGVTLAEVRATPGEVVLEIAPEPDGMYTTVFTARNGSEVYRADGLTPRYRPSRLDGYVRATVLSSRGTRAWTQPVFVPER